MNVRPIDAIAIAFLMVAAGKACSAGEAHGRSGAGRDSYSIVVHARWMSSNQSVPQMEAMRDRFQGDYVWFRRNGEVYVVRDVARLEEARRIFEGDPERQSLERERSAVARRERELDRENDRLEEDSDADEDGLALDEAGERRVEEMKATHRELENEIRALDGKEQDLDRKGDALDRAAEAKFWTLADRWIADGSAPPTAER